ncbi:hypothetical protein [Nocardia sp.]|nr:hypothetical protein [Nocardia sp.]
MDLLIAEADGRAAPEHICFQLTLMPRASTESERRRPSGPVE